MANASKTYTVESVKTVPEQVVGYRAAVERAREINREYQPAFGVTVSGADGITIITI